MKDECDEIHGMRDARKLTAIGYGERAEITVAADGRWIKLDIAHQTYSAGMTPTQARYLARKLYRLARLVEQRLVPSPTPATEEA